MRRTALLLASMSLAVLLASGAALAEEKLDQENAGPVQHSAHYEEFNSDQQYLAQGFTAGKTGKLSKVSVQIEKYACDPVADAPYKDIDVRIYWVDSSGHRVETPLTSTTLPASQVPCPTSYAIAPPWTDVTFDPANLQQVDRGRTYVIALEPERMPFDSNNPSYGWYYDSYYGGGDSYYRSLYPLEGNWSSPWGFDFLFRTYVDVADTDGDGLANDVDWCRYEAGPASNDGCPLDTVRPTGSVEINGGKLRTASRAVTLGLNATDPPPASGIDSMRLKNAGGNWTAWQTYVESRGWKLTRGAGKKTVYAQYRDAAGNVSARASDSITHRP